MNKETIEARIQASVKPQLDRADELLDHYTEGLPEHVWMSLAANILDHDFYHIQAARL